MKVAIILSGAIRSPERSLSTLKLFADDDVSVFMHVWTNSCWLQLDSFSRRPNIEPSIELIRQYNSVECRNDSWLDMRGEFINQLEEIKRLRPDLPRDLNNLGPLGMYYSLQQAFDPLWETINNYDLVVRLRYDCQMSRKPSPGAPGFVVPLANDFGGLSDQLAFYYPDKENLDKSQDNAAAYFALYSEITGLMVNGSPYGPETLLKASFDKAGVQPRREAFAYMLDERQC